MTIKESNFIAKNGSTFSHLLTVRAKVADLTVSLTVKYPGFFTPRLSYKVLFKGRVWRSYMFKLYFTLPSEPRIPFGF